MTGAAQGPGRAQVKLYFSGYAPTSVTRLEVWLDDRHCASLGPGREERVPSSAAAHRFHRHGSSGHRLTVKHSAPAGRTWCAPIWWTGAAGQTAARGTWRYVTS